MASRLNITRLSSQLTLSTSRPLTRLLHPPPLSQSNAIPTRPSSSMPRVTNTSVWTSMIPKFIRNRDDPSSSKKNKSPKSKEWNPATFFIIIFLLIGSQAIKMLGLRNEFANFNRSADAKLELLREIIDRLGKGEKVDVEKLLGAGDEAREKEWEEVLREIENEDALWRKSKEEETPKPSPETNKSDDIPSETTGDQKPRPFAFY